MKNISTIAAALLLGAAVHASALGTFVLNFDGQASNTDANAFAPSGFNINFGQFINKTDEFGDEIPNSETWTIDSGTVLATDPAEFNYGAAPSGTNALNVHDQTVLLTFDEPFDLTLFSTTLDASTFGDIAPSSILFYNAADSLIGTVNFDQSIPSAIVSTTGPINGVSKIVLPTTAFYDDVNVQGATAVPEPSTVGLLAISLGAAIVVSRKMKKSVV